MYSMDQFQYNISTDEIIPFNELEINDYHVYLYIFHAHKIPPHVGIISDGAFFSLKANGLDFDLAPEKINALIVRKEISTLIIKIDLKPTRDIREVFTTHGEHIRSGQTCLTPIDQYLFGHSNHKKIGELLSDLKRDNMISLVYGAYLPKDFKGIINYSTADINQRIETLKG